MNTLETTFEKSLSGKTILITGGTGSFGNAVVSRLLQFSVKQIVVFSRDEKKQLDMAHKYRSHKNKIRFIIGDVRDKDRVTYVMQGIDFVFHAAALKQVPHCEFFPSEALLTNTLGAHNVIMAAVHHNVERVVVLSTDKAVYPINVMGLTKSLMERIMIGASREKRSRTILCGTRYGNVMYTRGSVIPFFIQLIKEGRPLSVTDKKMTRFLMSLDDSVNLVLYALTHGANGEIYVKKASAANVGHLAEAIKSLFKYTGAIEEIGTRPGEKLHEFLISREEIFRTEDCGEYFKINPEVPDMDVERYYIKGEKKVGLQEEGYTSENTRQLSIEEIKEQLLSIPEVKEEVAAWFSRSA